MCSPCPKLRIAVIFVKNAEIFYQQRDSILGPLAPQASMLPLDHCRLSEVVREKANVYQITDDETSRTRGHSMKSYKPNSMSSFYTSFFSGFVLLTYGTLCLIRLCLLHLLLVSNTDCLVLTCHIMFCIYAFNVSFVLYFIGPYKSRFSCL